MDNGIVDRNKIQQCGFTEDILGLGNYKDKWKSFGWDVLEIDGHNMDEIYKSFKSISYKDKKPSLVISNTIKGKGVSFMENDNSWHGGGAISEFADQALAEVRKYKKYKDLF